MSEINDFFARLLIAPIVELKPKPVSKHPILISPFNRTIEELKLCYNLSYVENRATFNRTIEELKHQKQSRYRAR